MGISATDPIGLAMNRTGRMLFKPFDIGKWFVLGFAAFLAFLAEGGAGNLNSMNRLWGGGPGPPGQTLPEFVEELKQLFLRNAHWILPVAFVLLLLWIVIAWIRARGKFIFLDGVARNHAAIVEPWSRLRVEANSFFRFDLILSLGMTLALVVLGMIIYVLALPDLRTNTMGSAGITALVVGGTLLLLLGVVYVLIVWIAEDFLIPLMYLRSQPIGPAWTEFCTRILAGHVGVVLLFGLMRFLLGIAAAVIVMVGSCITCCIAALPYLSSVFFLPIFVFIRAYPLYFLGQFGDEFRVMTEMEPQPISAFPVIFNPPPQQPEPLTPDALEPMPPPLPPLPPREG